MRFQIEECRNRKEAESCLSWVGPAVSEIYGGDAEPQSADSARDFLLASLGKGRNLFLLAKEIGANRPVGFLFVADRKDDFLGVVSPFLYLLFTAPESRRLGIARELLARAEAMLRERGSRILIAPATHNDDAIISMGERRGYLRGREWMEKEL